MVNNVVKNKYYKIYRALYKRAKKENRSKKDKTYYENHHIVPRSLGGSNSKSNMVLLTAREHFLAHACLIRFLYDNHNHLAKTSFAFQMMCNTQKGNPNRYINSRIYEENKPRASKSRSNLYSGENHPSYGKKRSKETCTKISEKAKERYKSKKNHPSYGKKRSKETCAKISEKAKGRSAPNKGIPCLEETKVKIAEANKGRSHVLPDEKDLIERIEKIIALGEHLSIANIAKEIKIGWDRTRNIIHRAGIQHLLTPYTGKTYPKVSCRYCSHLFSTNNIKKHEKICKEKDIQWD